MWTKDGDDLVLTPRMKMKNFNKMIQIPKASFDDVGEYTCTATNKIGYIEHTITVRVKGKRHFQKSFLLHNSIKTVNILLFDSGSFLAGETH